MESNLYENNRIRIKLFFLILSTFLIFGCTNTSCRQPLREYKSGKKIVNTEPTSGQVFIYKYDGSIQCEADAGLTPENMRKQLGKIKVYSLEKRHDGLMHMRVCGSRTGQTNVYLIDVAELVEAKKRGFQVWDFK